MRITDSELRNATRMAKRKTGVTVAQVVEIIESKAKNSGARYRAEQIIKRIKAKVKETIGRTKVYGLAK